MPIVGTQQSPIQIDKAKTIQVNFGPDFLKFNYSRGISGHFEGDNFVFDPPQKKEDQKPWSITVDGTPWLVRKIHVHDNSEHLIDHEDPKRFECHLVHSAPDDPKAGSDKIVIGVFFRPDARAPSRVTLSELNQKIGDAKPGKGKPLSCQIAHTLHPGEFLPPEADHGRWYRYEGSLTSPKFNEDVSWFVLPASVPIRTKEFHQLKSCAHQHAREVFDLNRRFVLRSFP
jgi:carbonic anhydrase